MVPDLDSYEVMNPSAKPGLSPDITVPSSETISSFFTFKTIDYKTTFGSETTVALAMSLAGKQWRLFEYRDKLILKLAFWPVLLATWLAVTLVRFY